VIFEYFPLSIRFSSFHISSNTRLHLQTSHTQTYLISTTQTSHIMTGGLGESVRKGVGMVHGTGEAIRGKFNATVDTASGDKASAIRNEEIAQKGVDEWDRGYRGHGM
jgi:hypothetical protein